MAPEHYPEDTRYETVVASLLFLMTHYARSRCPRLARCIAGHMQCLASHPRADHVVRDICAGLHGSWEMTADVNAVQPRPLH